MWHTAIISLPSQYIHSLSSFLDGPLKYPQVGLALQEQIDSLLEETAAEATVRKIGM